MSRPTYEEKWADMVKVVEAKARADERRRIGEWLIAQAEVARAAPNGQHPETLSKTQASALNWAGVVVMEASDGQ